MMRWSQAFIPTLREDPAEAELVSHRLLLRAGYMRRLGAGIYIQLPLLQRVVEKIATIVREEMDRAGALEITMPVLHPGDLWRKTGRWYDMGPELMRMRDRHQTDLVLGATHEEVVTELVSDELRSYKQMPLNLYQIQVKFRDEIRPRFGLMRGREFLMKDAYSFDVDEAAHQGSYDKMRDAYFEIFRRCGLDTKMVEADTGAMGGKRAHEFMVVVDTDGGESDLLFCDSCDYAASLEQAESRMPEIVKEDEEVRPFRAVDTPGKRTIDEVTEFLNLPPTRLVKTLLYRAGDRIVAALVRGDRAVNTVKLSRHLEAPGVELLDDASVAEVTGAAVGYAGPVGLKDSVGIIVDEEVMAMRNFVVGANADDKHLVDVNLSDFSIGSSDAIRAAAAGESCARCEGGTLIGKRGIEVGNIFNLGLKYSESLGATYQDAEGNVRPAYMGSYGIGVTRTAQAAVERYNDDSGINWPVPIAPYQVLVACLDMKDESLCDASERLVTDLESAGVEVLYDDRQERPGVKFKDADLIGIPYRITIGRKALANGEVEFKPRGKPDFELVKVEAVVARCLAAIGEETP